MYVNEAMSTALLTCQPSSSLDEVARLMWEGDCGAIPVVTGNHKPVGIITDRDIAMSAMLNHLPLWDIPATTVIQGQQLCCCSQGEQLEACLARMEHKGIRRLLVTDDAGTLVGILSMGDAIALTRDEGAKRRNARVNVEQVLDMLRKVSAHHATSAGTLAQIQ